MTREERQLLELTARSLLKLEQDVRDRLAGIEAVLQALFVCRGNTDLALARRRVQIDLLQTKGTPSTYLKSFVEGVPGTMFLLEAPMAVNKPTGDNARKGAVKKRSQLKTTFRASAWTKRSKATGESICEKAGGEKSGEEVQGCAAREIVRVSRGRC
jgi:hypothetical protein